MSDTPVALDGPSPGGFVAPSNPKKPWRTPMVITTSMARDIDKPYASFEIAFTINGGAAGRTS